MSKYIELYPSNWLYNAGVVGFLRVLSNEQDTIDFNKDKLSVNLEDFIGQNSKCVKFDQEIKIEIPNWHYWYILEGMQENKKDIEEDSNKKKNKTKEKKDEKVFLEISVNSNNQKKVTFTEEELKKKIISVHDKEEKESLEYLYSYRACVSKLFPKGMMYQNQYPPNKLKDFNYFLSYFSKDKIFNSNSNKNKEKCLFCGSEKYELTPLDSKFMNLLMPSLSGFPNSFWNNDNNGIDSICSLCQFFLIHQHLAFTKLSDDSEIFINAPSFKVMYELNKLVKEIFGKSDKEGLKKREILAMSVIEYSRRIQTTLAQWTEMNIEIVTKSNDRIDFYSLPYEIVQIISDRKIAGLLSDIREFSILNLVLDGRFNELLDIAHTLIRIGTKGKQNDSDKKLINSLLKRFENKNNLINTAQKILNLYINIKEKRRTYA